MHALKELVEYYKEIYTLLVAQADRQVDAVYFKGEKIPLREVTGRWLEDTGRRVGKGGGLTEFAVEDNAGGEVFLYADVALLHFLLDVLTKEWLARMQGRAGSVLRLEAAEEGRFIRLSLSSSVAIYTEEEVREIFTPDASRYVYLLCKEIVRETDKLNNYCGCRIEMESLPDAGCRIGFTVPKYE